MILLLMRHGIAEDIHLSRGDIDRRDAARALTEEGWERARAMGAVMAAALSEPDVLLVSKRRRSIETAQAYLQGCGGNQERPFSTEASMDIDAAPDALREVLIPLYAEDPAVKVLAVGHMNSIAEIALELQGFPVGLPFEMKKGALLALKFDGCPSAHNGRVILSMNAKHAVALSRALKR